MGYFQGAVREELSKIEPDKFHKMKILTQERVLSIDSEADRVKIFKALRGMIEIIKRLPFIDNIAGENTERLSVIMRQQELKNPVAKVQN